MKIQITKNQDWNPAALPSQLRIQIICTYSNNLNNTDIAYSEPDILPEIVKPAQTSSKMHFKFEIWTA